MVMIIFYIMLLKNGMIKMYKINKLDLSDIKLDKTKKSFLSKLYFKMIELF